MIINVPVALVMMDVLINNSVIIIGLVAPVMMDEHLSRPLCRLAEVAREHGWHPLKCLDSDENLKPEHTLFCRELRFVAIYALFGDLWAKKVPFWVKNSVS